MKQNQSIEIAYLLNGEVVSVRRLSKRAESRGAMVTFLSVAGLSVGASMVVALALTAVHRVVFVPVFAGLWGLCCLGAAALAAVRASRRARVYQIGANIHDDAFSALALPLVRRVGDGYRIALMPGFTGRIDGDRAPLAVEGLAREGQGSSVDLPIELGARAELTLGAATFVIRSLPDDGPVPSLPAGMVRRLARRAVLPLELAALGSIFCAVPIGAQITEADMRSAISPRATPIEIERALRAEAQTQAWTLHQCFDVLPISCQHSGYVGVGVSLSRDGEMRDHWIARSTYSAACPVEQCMSDVVSGWFFEPLPASMRVVLPVQVLRTDRPLPYGAARAAADAERTAARNKRTVASNVN